MREGGFSATGHAGDDVEGELRDAAAQDVIEAAHAGRQGMDGDLGELARAFLRQFAIARGLLLFHFHLLTDNPNG